MAGSTREEFNEICGLLGKSSTFSTRNGIRDLLKKEYNIDVVHWNTGDRGSKENAPAEFRHKGQQINFEQVKGLIQGTWKPDDSITLEDFT